MKILVLLKYKQTTEENYNNTYADSVSWTVFDTLQGAECCVGCNVISVRFRNYNLMITIYICSANSSLN